MDAIIGLIPGLGDTLTSLASLYILNAGRRYGVPRVTMLRMAANIAVDYVVGVIPFFGDAFDVVWKANQKNVALLKRHVLATPAEERRARLGDWFVLAGLVVVLALVLVGAVTMAVWIWSVDFPLGFRLGQASDHARRELRGFGLAAARRCNASRSAIAVRRDGESPFVRLGRHLRPLALESRRSGGAMR